MITNEYTCKNSYDFRNEIINIPNSDNFFMASFDIKNLFTNIPLHETIDIICDKLFPDPSSNILGLTLSYFKTFLELSVLNSFFLFNNKFYRQIEGLGMGLPLGPTFANIFMCYHEENWLSDCPEDFKPLFYKRYIDDTFLLFEDQSHVPLFLTYLNSKHVNINFTFETEQNNILSFLDCEIHRLDNKFHSSVFRKNSFTGLGSVFSFSNLRFYFCDHFLKTMVFAHPFLIKF